MSKYAPLSYRLDDSQKEAPVVNWSGVNNRLPVDKLPPGLAAEGVNTRMRNGDIEPRRGVVKPGWLNRVAAGVDHKIYAAGDTLYGAGVFRDPNSVEWTLIATDGFIYRCRPNNARFALSLPPGVKVLSDCALVQAFNQMFCFRGRHLAPLVLNDLDTGFVDLLARWSSAATYQAAVLALERAADEIAYGPFQAVSSLTSAGDLARVVTTLEHGFVTGADITIRGANQAAYNGRFNITVIDPVTFTYQFTGSGTTPATGTITCSNMSFYWKALGSRVTLTTLTRSGTTATATKTAHGFTTGQYVTISGASPAAFNGTYVITVTGANTFTYTLAADPGADATGTLLAQTSVVLAGQSPSTNPEAWQQLYNILPNADDALFINNRLLVPTAYTPGAEGYDASSNYTKKDYIVSTDILDYIHFDFTDEFRINQGDDSEIMSLCKYDNNTVIVCKGRAWGVLGNIQLDITQATYEPHGGFYGACSLRSAVAAGLNVYFPASQRGVVGLNQTVQGLVQSTNVALSNDVDGWVRQIDWAKADRIRLAWWDDKLYVSVPMGSPQGAVTVNGMAIMVYDFRTEQWAGMDAGPAICPKDFFTATYQGRDRLFFIGFDGWVNLMEEATAGDQVEDAASASNLTYEEIVMDTTLGGGLFGEVGPKRFPMVELGLAVWNSNFSVTAGTGTMQRTRATITDKSFSRAKYLKPFDRADYDPTNVNADFAEPNRGDYSVTLNNGFYCGGGLNAGQFQELFFRPSTKTLSGRYPTFRFINTQGRLKIKAVAPVAEDGPRRMGISF